MKKISIYVLFSLFLVASYVGIDVQLGYRIWTEEYRRDFAFKVDHLVDEGYLANAFLRATDNTDQLFSLLHSRAEARAVDFWILYHRGEVVKTNLETKQISALRISSDELNHPNKIYSLNDTNHSYLVTDLDHGFTLVLGKTYALDQYLAYQLQERQKMVWVDMLVACMAAIGIFAYFFRDIRRSLRRLSGSNKRKYSGVQVHSKEADLIMRGLEAYETHTEKLIAEKDRLSWQVLPSLRTELMSGRNPPYDFTCTLVRTDINNFSKIYNQFSVDDFTSIINDFFTDVTHVVSRYGGLIHEFIGDEVIFYFKDEDVGNSPAIALSAIRDINEIASHYNLRTLKENGYGFTVKSSFAHGSIRFRRFVNGFNLAGATLIETVRILSQIHERDGNVVVFDDRHLKQIEEIATAAPYMRAVLKGSTDEKNLYVYTGHVALEKILPGAASKNFENLQYYRSDRDLIETLNWLFNRVNRSDYSVALKAVSVLRKVHVTKGDFSVSITLADWLENLLGRLTRIDVIHREPHLRVIASVIMLIENLVPRDQFDERLEGICRQVASMSNRRLIANALEVLTFMKVAAEPNLSKKLIEHEDNRVVANALVHEGSHEITPLVLKRLRKMLSAKQTLFVASGLYALGEIASFHRKRDLVYYQTQMELLTIVAALPVYVSHANEMVRRQAFVAAKKIDDPVVLARIAEHVKSSASIQIQKEAQQFLGQILAQPLAEKATSVSSTRRSA